MHFVSDKPSARGARRERVAHKPGTNTADASQTFGKLTRHIQDCAALHHEQDAHDQREQHASAAARATVTGGHEDTQHDGEHHTQDDSLNHQPDDVTRVHGELAPPHGRMQRHQEHERQQEEHERGRERHRDLRDTVGDDCHTASDSDHGSEHAAPRQATAALPRREMTRIVAGPKQASLRVHYPVQVGVHCATRAGHGLMGRGARPHSVHLVQRPVVLNDAAAHVHGRVAHQSCVRVRQSIAALGRIPGSVQVIVGCAPLGLHVWAEIERPPILTHESTHSR